MSTRPRQSLDGTWSFWTDPTAVYTHTTLEADASRTITVPAPWQSQADDLRYYSGVAWYQRTVEIPTDLQGDALILGFGAVDYRADVWWNDVHLGTHEGGYLPFQWDVAGLVNPGTNTVTVRVDDPVALFNEIPHGKQSWYGPLSGIWQSVWLEQRAVFHTQTLHIYPSLDTGAVRVQVHLATPTNQDTSARLTILDPNNQAVAKTTTPLTPDQIEFSFDLNVATPLAWSPDAPHLYQLAVDLCQADDVVDSITDSFGFRTIEARDGRLYLNGEVLYLRGALDQDYYPDTISTPPSTEFLEKQLRLAKELGLNCLRCHIKVPDPRYYEVADRLGMLIWTELPNWRLLTTDSMQRGRETLQGIVERDSNHPSIIAWTIINEDWGTNLYNDSGHRTWLKEMYTWMKTVDPTRLIVDNSACVGNFHMQTDVEDFHYYKGIPDQRAEWDTFVDELASGKAPTFSPHGDAVRTRQEPIILSEFGNWGLPDADLLLEDGKEPWWFETGLESGDAVYPHAVRTRFQRWELERVFGSWQSFIEASQWQEYLSLKYEIESIRRRSEISGYVITEFTDVHWECNGLLDMRRNRKAFHDAFAAINANTVIIPCWERTSYWADEEIRVEVSVAHGGGTDLPSGRLHYQITDGYNSTLDVESLTAGEVQSVGTTTLSAPDMANAGTVSLNFDLHSESGDVVATNHLPLTIYPSRDDSYPHPAKLWVADRDMATALATLGYSAAATPDDVDVLVVSTINDDVLAWARAGKTIVLTVQDVTAFGNGMMGIRVSPRNNTVWRGDWASSFAWLRREGPFARIPGSPMLDYTFDALTPDFVLTGFGPWEYVHNVHAGLFVGWIHKHVALLAEIAYGAGKIVATTFRFDPAVLGSDPTVTTLWDAIIELGTAHQRTTAGELPEPQANSLAL